MNTTNVLDLQFITNPPTKSEPKENEAIPFLLSLNEPPQPVVAPQESTEDHKDTSVFSSLKYLQKSPFYSEDFIEVKCTNVHPKRSEDTVANTVVQDSTPKTLALNGDLIQKETQEVNELMGQQEQLLVANSTTSGGIRIVPTETELKEFRKKMMGMDCKKIAAELITVIQEGKGKQQTVCVSK